MLQPSNWGHFSTNIQRIKIIFSTCWWTVKIFHIRLMEWLYELSRIWKYVCDNEVDDFSVSFGLWPIRINSTPTLLLIIYSVENVSKNKPVFFYFRLCNIWRVLSAYPFFLWWLWEYVYFILSSSNRISLRISQFSQLFWCNIWDNVFLADQFLLCWLWRHVHFIILLSSNRKWRRLLKSTLDMKGAR